MLGLITKTGYSILRYAFFNYFKQRLQIIVFTCFFSPHLAITFTNV